MDYMRNLIWPQEQQQNRTWLQELNDEMSLSWSKVAPFESATGYLLIKKKKKKEKTLS
jgi:hypothetical protein